MNGLSPELYEEIKSRIPNGWIVVTNGKVKPKDKLYYAYLGGNGEFQEARYGDDIGELVEDRICVIRKNKMIIPKGYHTVKKGKIKADDLIYNPTRGYFQRGTFSVDMSVSDFMCVVRKRMAQKNSRLGVSFKSIVRRMRDDKEDSVSNS